MESVTYIKNVRISAKKLRFILPDLKKLNPVVALDHLYYSPKRAARILYQALRSAVINAKTTLKSADDLLQFKLFTVEEGQRMKRFKAGGRGTAKPILRRTAHIRIIIRAEAASTTKPAVAAKSGNQKTKITRKKVVKSKKITNKNLPAK